jgi:hypothetical protein
MRVDFTGASSLSVVEYMRNGPKGNESSWPTSVPASSNPLTTAVTASRTALPRVVIIPRSSCMAASVTLVAALPARGGQDPVTRW